MKRTVVFPVVLALAVSATLAAKDLNIVLKWNPNEKQSMPVLETTGGIFSLAIPVIVDKR